MRSRVIVIVLMLGVSIGACAGPTGSGSTGRTSVVATTTILGDVVSNVVGSDADVEVLVPIGSDPHDFQASARQVAAVNEADLVVANGLGLEEVLADILQAAADDGVQVLSVAPELDPIAYATHGAGSSGSEADQHREQDPHVWMDPLRMARAAELIAERLSEISPGVDWRGRASAYAEELARTDLAVAELLSSIPVSERKLVTNHDSLGYFADRYGFEVIGVVIPGGSTMGEPSSEALARLIEVVRKEDVRVLFGETTQPNALAVAVAEEIGRDVEVMELFSGSLGEPGSGAETLIDMLTTNAKRIADALGG